MRYTHGVEELFVELESSKSAFSIIQSSYSCVITNKKVCVREMHLLQCVSMLRHENKRRIDVSKTRKIKRDVCPLLKFRKFSSPGFDVSMRSSLPIWIVRWKRLSCTHTHKRKIVTLLRQVKACERTLMLFAGTVTSHLNLSEPLFVMVALLFFKNEGVLTNQ
jgi:hypothetical protein